MIGRAGEAGVGPAKTGGAREEKGVFVLDSSFFFFLSSIPGIRSLLGY